MATKSTPNRKPSPAESAVAADHRRRARAAKIAETSQKQAPASARKRPKSADVHKTPAVVLFPEATPEQIVADVAAWWNLAGPLPIPRAPIACPVCAGPAYPRAWSVNRLNPPQNRAHAHRLPWRCDVSIKCHRCSAVWAHGLAITEADAARFGADTGALRAAAYTWRQARDRLAGFMEV